MLSAAMFFLVACESMDEKDGGKYSLGTTCRILESRGNFTSFIKALDRSGYRRLVDGGGLVTGFCSGRRSIRQLSPKQIWYV